MIKYYLYKGDGGDIVDQCNAHMRGTGGLRVYYLDDADVAVAPRLSRILNEERLDAPRLGTLVFHPSLLPRHSGPDAVNDTLASGDSFTGVTWFWASEHVDRGDIAEQQVVDIPDGVSAGRLYHSVLVPAGIEAFSRVWTQLSLGYIRRVKQDARSGG